MKSSPPSSSQPSQEESTQTTKSASCLPSLQASVVWEFRSSVIWPNLNSATQNCSPSSSVKTSLNKKTKATLTKTKSRDWKRHSNLNAHSLIVRSWKTLNINRQTRWKSYSRSTACQDHLSGYRHSPSKTKAFSFNKQSFWDLIKIRYGHQVDRLPNVCVCGSPFNLEHALTCKKGGFVTLRHNSIRNITAALLVQWRESKVEPALTALSGENFEKKSTNTQDNARLDIADFGFLAKRHSLT